MFISIEENKSLLQRVSLNISTFVNDNVTAFLINQRPFGYVSDDAE